MNTSLTTSAVLSIALLAGCSTTQQVQLAKTTPTRTIQTVAQAPAEDNAADMNANLESALTSASLTVKAPLPQGARTSTEVDAVVSYADVWRWDIVMYLKSVTIRIYDAKSGDLIVTGDWKDSALHGFRDAKTVVQGVVNDMLVKVRVATRIEAGKSD